MASLRGFLGASGGAVSSLPLFDALHYDVK
jgi:hypothetical protein